MQTMPQETAQEQRPALDARRPGGVILGTAAAAWCGWGIARLADVSLTVDQGGSVREVGPVAVVVSTLLVGVVAALTQLVMLRWRGGLRGWLILSATVLVVSLVGPTSATTTGGTLTLVALHLLVGAVLIVALRVRHHER